MKITIALAVLLSGIALADIPPPPPDDPLGPDCQPFVGIWTPSVPTVSRNSTSWRVIAVGSEKAAIIRYANLQDVNLVVESHDAALTCEATADGVTILTFKAGDDDLKLAARMTGEATFTAEREATYNQPGPPPDDWKGEIIVTTWTRIAR